MNKYIIKKTENEFVLVPVTINKYGIGKYGETVFKSTKRKNCIEYAKKNKLDYSIMNTREYGCKW